MLCSAGRRVGSRTSSLTLHTMLRRTRTLRHSCTYYPGVVGNFLDHYATFGWTEGRNPSAQFDGARYLAENPDVAAAGMNPLAHFLQFGRYEGRQYYPIGNARRPDLDHAMADRLAKMAALSWTTCSTTCCTPTSQPLGWIRTCTMLCSAGRRVGCRTSSLTLHTMLRRTRVTGNLLDITCQRMDEGKNPSASSTAPATWRRIPTWLPQG